MFKSLVKVGHQMMVGTTTSSLSSSMMVFNSTISWSRFYCDQNSPSSTVPPTSIIPELPTTILINHEKEIKKLTKEKKKIARKIKTTKHDLKMEESSVEKELEKLLKKKRAPNAYALFVRDNAQKNIPKDQNSKIMAKKWKEINENERQKYKDLAEEEKVKVEQSNSTLPTPPKKPLSAYIEFFKEYRLSEPTGLNLIDVAKKCSEEWRIMDDKDKQQYKVKNEKNKEEYKLQKQKYDEYVNKIKLSLQEKYQINHPVKTSQVKQ